MANDPPKPTPADTGPGTYSDPPGVDHKPDNTGAPAEPYAPIAWTRGRDPYAVAGALGQPQFAPAGTPPPTPPVVLPVLSSISPSSADVDGGQVVLTLHGTGFQAGAFVIDIADTGDLPAIVDSSVQLHVLLSPTLLATIYNDLGGAPTNVGVRNPDGSVTSTKPFTVYSLSSSSSSSSSSSPSSSSSSSSS